MKKKIFYIAVVVISLAIIAGSTFALFTTQDRARNVITTGNVEIFVVEEQEGGTAYPGEPISIMPGTTVSKIAMAQAAEESAAAWIRMKIDAVVTGADKQVMDLTQAELDRIITIAINDEAWTEQDGWYYYSQSIEDGARTEPLFEEVQFSGPNMGNEYKNATVEIIVTTQAVQKAHNGDTVLEAQGWPEN